MTNKNRNKHREQNYRNILAKYTLKAVKKRACYHDSTMSKAEIHAYYDSLPRLRLPLPETFLS